MRTWTPFYLAATTYLLAGATAYYEGYQKFLQDHQDNPRTKTENAEYCNILMHHRGLLLSCKPYNVFIHTSETHLRNVCGPGGYPYHGIDKRQSRKAYPVTVCRLGMITHDGQCIYYATFGTRHIILSCDENKLPVLLDEVLTMAPKF